MTDYLIKLKLEVDADSTAQARIWIDGAIPGDLWSETEVALEHDGQGAYSGRFTAPEGRFMYRVGMLARPGTIWSLSIQALGSNGHELLFDSDEVTLPKEWLVGMCEDRAPRLVSFGSFPNANAASQPVSPCP